MDSTHTLSTKTVTTTNIAQIACDALIVGVYATQASKMGSKQVKTQHEFPPASATIIAALKLSPAALTDLPTALGKTHTFYPSEANGIKASRVVMVGLGERGKFSAANLTKALRSAILDCSQGAAKTVVNGLMELDVSGIDAAAHAKLTLTLAHEVCYRYDTTLTTKAKPIALQTLVFPALDAAQAKAITKGAAQGSAIGMGSSFTRHLANLPANICTPTYLAKQAQQLAKKFAFDCEVLERKQLQALKMGSFLSVAAGSDEPPRLIVMKYNGGKKGAAPQVLVGKGVTFDTGGISLKPGEGMDEMKYDMCGAASVLGTFYAVTALKLPINLVGIIAATENMPNGHATKPGDVVTSMSGKTIEILNTDAEGRLILCDALTYAERFKPAAVVDIATLTGACIIALGAVNSGLFANNDALANKLLAASAAAQDPAWRMPLDDAYSEQLKSNFADLANIGGRPAGSVTAACFLSKFTTNYPWAHLDIAGTAWRSGATKGATARPVGLLTQYLIDCTA